MNENINFPKQLIKGRIAEIIFEQMFREAGKFMILRSGYEYMLSGLAQYKQLPEVENYLKKIRHTPDFILMSDDKKYAFIVEIKYITHRTLKKITKIALEILKIQNPSWLFVASPDGFFFGSCNKIKNNNGKINRLGVTWVSKEIQDKYLDLMNEFRPKN